MNVRTARKPPKRIDTRYISALRLQSYGADNLYPQHLEEITAASGTATTCLSRYAKFIEGYGFLDDVLAELNKEVLPF